MDKNIKLCYYKVFTQSGTGYVCVALKRPEKDALDRTYQAGFSFCAPQDQRKFSKSIARNMAIGRLNGGSNTITFNPANIGAHDKDLHINDIFNEVLQEAASTIVDDNFSFAPSWFVRAYAKGRFEPGLTQTQVSKAV